MPTEKIILDIQAQIKDARRQIKQLRTDVKGTQENMKGVNKEMGTMNKLGVQAATAMAGIFSVQAIGQFLRKIIDVRSEFEKYEAVLKVSLGSQAAAAREMENLVRFASQTPYALTELTNAFVKLNNYGLKPSMEEMRKMGDLAASVGKGFDQLAEAIADATVGEMERLKEFGIKAKQSGDMVQFTFKGVTTEVERTSDAINEYILSLGDLEGVSGSMAEIADTLGGKISNLGDAFDKLLNTIGAEGGGVLKGFFDGAIFGVEQTELAVARGSAKRGLLGPLWKALFGNRGEAVADAQTAAMDVSSAFAASVLNVMQRLGINRIFGVDQAQLEALSMGMSEEAKIIIDIQKDLWAELEKAREKAAAEEEKKRIAREKATAEEEARIRKGEKQREAEFLRRREEEYTDLVEKNSKVRVNYTVEETDAKLAEGNRYADNTKEREEQNQQDIIDLKWEGVGENVELLNFLSKTAANVTEEGSALHKASSITATLIETIKASVAAYRWAAGFSGPIGGAIAAASALAFGYAQVKRIQSYGEGGYTGRENTGFRDRWGPIAGYVHQDEFVFSKDKTKKLRPLFEAIHKNKISADSLAELTKRGFINDMVKVEMRTDPLETRVDKIYRKMSEKKPAYYDDHTQKVRGNTTYRFK